MSENIALIGYGNMGRALASGWVASGRDAGTITVVESHEPAASAARSAGFPILARPGEADVIVLAIKPKQLPGAVAALGPIPAGTVLLSIAAGCTLGSIEVAAGGDVAVVRAMPNTPAAIGRGMTGLCANSSVTEDQRALCGQLMEAVGQVVWVEDETMMDAVTAVSGSGPAYVFLLIEALAEAGRQVGLSPAVADQLATQTVAGAGAYAAASGSPADELRRQVTSPNGTTEAALRVLTAEGAMERLIGAAVSAAARRSRELAGG